MRNVRQVARATSAGSGCGSCVNRLRAILQATDEVQNSTLVSVG